MNFRIYNKKEQSYIQDAEFYINCSGSVYFEDLHEGELYKPDQEDFIVQRSTGLFDANGVEIFEGDWVTWIYSLDNLKEEGRVVWSPSQVALVIDVSGRHSIDDKYGDFGYMHKDYNYKIIQKQ